MRINGGGHSSAADSGAAAATPDNVTPIQLPCGTVGRCVGRCPCLSTLPLGCGGPSVESECRSPRPLSGGAGKVYILGHRCGDIYGFLRCDAVQV